MEIAGSDGGGKKKKPPEGENNDNSKTKRKMKTASQLEILENTYAGFCIFSLNFCSCVFWG